jgi:hypothetical protein
MLLFRLLERNDKTYSLSPSFGAHALFLRLNFFIKYLNLLAEFLLQTFVPLESSETDQECDQVGAKAQRSHGARKVKTNI